MVTRVAGDVFARAVPTPVPTSETARPGDGAYARPMMLAGLPVSDNAIDAELVRAAGGDDLADRLERTLTDASC